MKTRNTLLIILLLVVAAGGAYALLDKDVALPSPSPTSFGQGPIDDFDISGTIQSIDIGQMTLRGQDGTITPLTTFDSTLYYNEHTQAIARTSFKVGQWVVVRGTRHISGEAVAGSVMKWYAPGTAPDWVTNQ